MTLRVEREGAVARVVIDRADRRNALNRAMWEAIPGVLQRLSHDADVRVVVLTGAEPGLFSAGADIAEMLWHRDDGEWLADNQAAINRAQYELTRFPLPTVAVVDGDCIGGGCGLALACDLRIASARARFGITPARLGLVYPLHDVKLLVDLVGPGQARRLLYTGGFIDAAEAERIGLIEMVNEHPDALVAMIAANARSSVRTMKDFVRRVLDGQGTDDHATRTAFAIALSSADFREGAAAFLEKRAPHFD